MGGCTLVQTVCRLRPRNNEPLKNDFGFLSSDLAWVTVEISGPMLFFDGGAERRLGEQVNGSIAKEVTPRMTIGA